MIGKRSGLLGARCGLGGPWGLGNEIRLRGRSQHLRDLSPRGARPNADALGHAAQFPRSQLVQDQKSSSPIGVCFLVSKVVTNSHFPQRMKWSKTLNQS